VKVQGAASEAPQEATWQTRLQRGPGVQLPATHLSFFEQLLPSEQVELVAAFVNEQVELGKHTPILHPILPFGQLEVPAQTPFEHTSLVVQESPSSQAPELAGVKVQLPVAILQPGIWQGSLEVQSFLPVTQAPSVQMLSAHLSLSGLHETPLSLLAYSQAPVLVLQLPCSQIPRTQGAPVVPEQVPSD